MAVNGPNRTTRSNVLKPDINTTVFIIPRKYPQSFQLHQPPPFKPDGQLDLSTVPLSLLFVCFPTWSVCNAFAGCVNIAFKRHPPRGLKLLVAFRKRVKCVSDIRTRIPLGALARHPRFPIVVANSQTMSSFFTFSLPLCACGLYDCRCRARLGYETTTDLTGPSIFAYRTLTTPNGCPYSLWGLRWFFSPKSFYRAKKLALVAIRVSFPSNQRRKCSAAARINENLIFLLLKYRLT